MWWLHYALYVSGFILALALLTQVLQQRRAPGSTAAWLLVMMLLPHVGIPLFLLFGFRKIRWVKSRKQVLSTPQAYALTPAHLQPLEKLLLSSGSPPARGANHVELFDTPQGAYAGLIHSLASARKSIHITTFIFKLDEVGTSVLKILEERARAGIQVRLLLDGLGSFSTFRWRLKDLIRAGAEVGYFLPLVHIPFFGHSNLRNHRKLVIIDGESAILGGMNIASDYMGPGHGDHWVDLSFRVEGPAVADLNQVFSADWKFATHKDVGPVSAPDRRGEEVLQITPSGPDVVGDPLYDALASGIFAAQRRVWIATPYFIPDETLSKALELAARRGVDVRVLVPAVSNHHLADFCRRSYVRQVLAAGGKVLYFPKMLHAKAVIVDDAFSLVGSANLDLRSLLLNFELGLFTYSPHSIRRLADWFEQRFDQSQTGTVREQWLLNSLDGFGRIIGPLL